MKILIVCYSVYGHIHRMAEAISDGAREVKDAKQRHSLGARKQNMRSSTICGI
jgi:multimeric flavodoxin WrbA